MEWGSLMVSGGIGGFVYGKWGLNCGVGVEVLGGIIGCMSVGMVEIGKEGIEGVEEEKFLREVGIGYKGIGENKGVLRLVWIGGMNMLIYMGMNGVFGVMSMNYLEGSRLDGWVVEIVFGVGMLLGGVVLGGWGGLKKGMGNMMGCMFVMGV